MMGASQKVIDDVVPGSASAWLLQMRERFVDRRAQRQRARRPVAGRARRRPPGVGDAANQAPFGDAGADHPRVAHGQILNGDPADAARGGPMLRGSPARRA